MSEKNDRHNADDQSPTPTSPAEAEVAATEPMQATCPKCGQTKFKIQDAGDRFEVLIVFCASCGHIVGTTPNPREAARLIMMALTRGSRDAFAHPVLHTKIATDVFG